MADIKKLSPILFKWEGGFSDDPDDRGGETNMGVTLSTWKAVGYDKDGDGDIDGEDIRILSKEDAMMVLKKYYWDRWRADEIINQSVANILVDWVWCSGKWGIVIPQKILGVKADGIVGEKTIEKINLVNPFKLLIEIYNARVSFIKNIIKKDPSQKKFEDGWMNRLNDYI